MAAQAAQATGLGQQTLQQMLPVIASMIMGGLFKQSTNQLNPGQFQPGQQAAGFGGSGNPLQEIIEQMMRQGGQMGGGKWGGGQQQAPQQRQAPPPEQGQSGDPFDNPFGKVLKDMFGGADSRNAGEHAGRNARRPAAAAASAEAGRAGARGRVARAAAESVWRQPARQDLRGDAEGRAGWSRASARRTAATAAASAAPDRAGGSADRARRRNPYDDLFGEMFETGAKQRGEYQKGIESIFDQFSKGMDRYR